MPTSAHTFTPVDQCKCIAPVLYYDLMNICLANPQSSGVSDTNVFPGASNVYRKVMVLLRSLLQRPISLADIDRSPNKETVLVEYFAPYGVII